MSLANYAAGAIMMPYAPFLEAAETHRYDIDRLCALFGASVEQVAHRLTTLGRSGARGIPFFMLRVDAAGNISKRFAGESLPLLALRRHLPALEPPFAPSRRRAGSSPRSSRRPTASASSPSAAPSTRSVRLDPREDSQLAIGLGCDVKYAPRIAYADGLDLAVPYVTAIGPACAICPRVRCPQRAAAARRHDADRQRDQEDDLALPVPGGLERKRGIPGRLRSRNRARRGPSAPRSAAAA